MKTLSAIILSCTLAATSAAAEENHGFVRGGACTAEQSGTYALVDTESPLTCIKGIWRDVSELQMATSHISKYSKEGKLLWEYQTASLVGLPLSYSASDAKYKHLIRTEVGSLLANGKALVSVSVSEANFGFQIDKSWETSFVSAIPLNTPTVIATDDTGAQYRMLVTR